MPNPYYLSPAGLRAVRARAQQLRHYLQSRRVARVVADLAAVRGAR